ncbi:protein rtoA-like [Ruditapes philippinarum]|uniref:protein rtoA-like n=1 Tax=Ruditapes philippinarum TaxID=129788 RepID=UPI00295B528E|nr:protein rtoA-like [Ruditapes philippinarum]
MKEVILQFPKSVCPTTSSERVIILGSSYQRMLNALLRTFILFATFVAATRGTYVVDTYNSLDIDETSSLEQSINAESNTETLEISIWSPWGAFNGGGSTEESGTARTTVKPHSIKSVGSQTSDDNSNSVDSATANDGASVKSISLNSGASNNGDENAGGGLNGGSSSKVSEINRTTVKPKSIKSSGSQTSDDNFNSVDSATANDGASVKSISLNSGASNNGDGNAGSGLNGGSSSKVSEINRTTVKPKSIKSSESQTSDGNSNSVDSATANDGASVKSISLNSGASNNVDTYNSLDIDETSSLEQSINAESNTETLEISIWSPWGAFNGGGSTEESGTARTTVKPHSIISAGSQTSDDNSNSVDSATANDGASVKSISLNSGPSNNYDGNAGGGLNGGSSSKVSEINRTTVKRALNLLNLKRLTATLTQSIVPRLMMELL